MRELCSDLNTKVLSVVLEIKNVMKNLILFKVYLSFLREGLLHMFPAGTDLFTYSSVINLSEIFRLTLRNGMVAIKKHSC